MNIAASTPATHKLVVRHRDRPVVLAHVFNVLKIADINVQVTQNIIFDGAESAVAQIDIDSPPPDSVMRQIRTGCP